MQKKIGYGYLDYSGLVESVKHVSERDLHFVIYFFPRTYFPLLSVALIVLLGSLQAHILVHQSFYSDLSKGNVSLNSKCLNIKCLTNPQSNIFSSISKFQVPKSLKNKRLQHPYPFQGGFVIVSYNTLHVLDLNPCKLPFRRSSVKFGGGVQKCNLHVFFL